MFAKFIFLIEQYRIFCGILVLSIIPALAEAQSSSGKSFGLNGQWSGHIKCDYPNFSYDRFMVTVRGVRTDVQTEKYKYVGQFTLSENMKGGFWTVKRTDGKNFSATVTFSEKFLALSGVTSSGCNLKAYKVGDVRLVDVGASPNSPKPERTYLERCSLTVAQIKKAQTYLKELGLYRYKIDGVVGGGTLAAIRKARKMIGAKASRSECLKVEDIRAFDQLAAETRCSPDSLAQCSDQTICDRATILRDGIRSWNFEQRPYVSFAQQRSLDCKITIDNTPFKKEEAIFYLAQLTDFVSKNLDDFDLNFAREFDKVRPITQGDWSKDLSEEFELFRFYIAKFPTFQNYLNEVRLAADKKTQKRLAELRDSLSQELVVLTQWAKTNVLDPKAAEIADVEAKAGDKTFQSVNELEQLLAEAQRLMSATGIQGGPVRETALKAIDNLHTPSSIYIFVNTSGNASSVYKSLDGEFKFERNKGTYCLTEKLDDFDYYLLRQIIFEQFEGLDSVDSDCSNGSDLFVVRGNELTTERIFDLMPLVGLTQVAELSKADRDRAYAQLTFLQEAIQKDVLEGARVGFGLLKTDQEASQLCAVIIGEEEGHKKQLTQNQFLMNALDLQWDGFAKITENSEEAFKFLQRGQCDAIYAGSLDLGRLYLAANVADITMNFLPIWVTKGAVVASQDEYEASVKAVSEAEQKLIDQAKLSERARQSAAETAASRQLKLREKNGLRFMVLKDKLQDIVFAATSFGLNNSPNQDGYDKKYLEQSFVDQTSRYSPFDDIIADMQKFAAERWEITEQRVDQIDYGEASFKGRTVDAVQVKLWIASKNRLIGKYSEYCRHVHAINDEDFDMWRNLTVSSCDRSEVTEQWKLDNAFTSKWVVSPD